MAALLTVIERLGGKSLWEFRHWNYNIKKNTYQNETRNAEKTMEWRNGYLEEDMTLNNNA